MQVTSVCPFKWCSASFAANMILSGSKSLYFVISYPHFAG